MNPELENKITQLRKGILELAIMGFLYQESHYGYSLVKVLNAGGGLSVKEGSIYPILQRMMREGLLDAEWVESPHGPPRKYYHLTAPGKVIYEGLVGEFCRLVKIVLEPSAVFPADRTDEDSGSNLNIRRR